jgi:predicted small lipoprotein YifL
MRWRVVPTLVTVLALAALVALTACGGGGGGEEEPAATAPAGETPTQAPTGERLTPTPEGVSPEAAASPTATINLCDLVTPEEVEEALGESVTDTRDLDTVSCRYSTASTSSVSIEQGSRQIFEEGIYGAGAPREPVPGIGDEAAWFGEVAPRYLSVRLGDFYFQIRLLLPDVDSATQLEIAKGLAAKAVERIP